MTSANVVLNATFELLECPPCQLAATIASTTSEMERTAIGSLLAAIAHSLWRPLPVCRPHEAANYVRPLLSLLCGASTSEVISARRQAGQRKPREAGIVAAGVLGGLLTPTTDASDAIIIWSDMGTAAFSGPMFACCLPIHHSANVLDNHLTEALATHFSAHIYLRRQCTAPDVAAIVRGILPASARQQGPAAPRDVAALHAFLDLFWRVEEDAIRQARRMWASTASPTIHGRYYFYTRLMEYRGLIV